MPLHAKPGGTARLTLRPSVGTGRFFLQSSEPSARSEDGVWGLVPRLGIWGMKSPNVPQIAKRSKKKAVRERSVT